MICISDTTRNRTTWQPVPSQARVDSFSDGQWWQSKRFQLDRRWGVKWLGSVAGLKVECSQSHRFHSTSLCGSRFPSSYFDNHHMMVYTLCPGKKAPTAISVGAPFIRTQCTVHAARVVKTCFYRFRRLSSWWRKAHFQRRHDGMTCFHIYCRGWITATVYFLAYLSVLRFLPLQRVLDASAWLVMSLLPLDHY